MRTRKDLLQAASRLMRQGRKPSLDEIAEEALVSRATAYRYFPSVEPLLIEASLDVAVPEAKDLLTETSPDDPVARLELVDSALHEVILANETPLRMMLVSSLQRGIGANADGATPARQNRRTPLIEAALEPAKKQFKPARCARDVATRVGARHWYGSDVGVEGCLAARRRRGAQGQALGDTGPGRCGQESPGRQLNRRMQPWNWK
jgi:AcrR family transcriptional regulator